MPDQIFQGTEIAQVLIRTNLDGCFTFSACLPINPIWKAHLCCRTLVWVMVLWHSQAVPLKTLRTKTMCLQFCVTEDTSGRPARTRLGGNLISQLPLFSLAFSGSDLQPLPFPPTHPTYLAFSVALHGIFCPRPSPICYTLLPTAYLSLYIPILLLFPSSFIFPSFYFFYLF